MKETLKQLLQTPNLKYSELWLPSRTDWSDSSHLNNNFWFTIKQLEHQTIVTTKVTNFIDSENTILKSRKIRVYPTADQKKILKQMFGISRFMFNKTIEFVNNGAKPNRFEIQKEILALTPEDDKTPYKVKQMAIDDACIALNNAIKKAKKSGQFQQVSFRSRKAKRDSFYIPKKSLSYSNNGILRGVYKRTLGDMYFSETVDFKIEHDCKFVHQDGRYYLIIPITTNIKQVSPDSQRQSLVALDPGVRTFLTAYDSQKAFKIGEYDFKIIYQILLQLDKTISKKSLTKGAKNKRIYNRLLSNYKFRIKNLVKEMHNQTAIILVKNYNEIILPEFRSSKMVGKLHSKTCRSLLTWSHFSFKQHLLSKAKEYSSKVTLVNEAYTSKTCTNCMTINTIGGKEQWVCKYCGFEHDRDISASRNIYILGSGRFTPKQLGIVNDCQKLLTLKDRSLLGL